jgi:hypothetical protein
VDIQGLALEGDRRLTEVGRIELHTGLRARELGPATTI